MNNGGEYLSEGDTLYVILPYFNFLQSEYSVKNLNIFIKNMSLQKNVKIFLIEGIFEEDRQLLDYTNIVYKHIKIPLQDILWVKENLINIGFKHLPDSWQYACWADRDILFCDPNWSINVIEKLKTSDIIQPWKEVLFLNKVHNVDPVAERHDHSTQYKSYYSVGYVHATKTKVKYAWPGQAWAVNKNFYEKIGGLYEYCIVGGGDSHLVMNILSKYIKHKRCVLSYVDGLIIHYYHGSIKNRQYITRTDILSKHKFDPSKDLTKNELGILCFTDEGCRMKDDNKEYFLKRLEN